MIETAVQAAMSAYLSGNLRDAESIAKNVLSAAPNHPPALVVVALVCARTGRKPAAIAYLQNATRRDPNSFEAHISLSTLLFGENKSDEAIELAERAIEISPHDPDSYRHFSRDLMQAGMATRALDTLTRGALAVPTDASLHQDVAALCTELGQTREAALAWMRTLEINPDLLIGWLKLGGLHLSASAFEPAVECGRRAVAIDPDSSDARILLALSLAESGGAAEAEVHLRRAIDLNPTEHIAYAALGLSLQEQGRFDEARPYLEHTLQICPTNGQAHYALVRTRKTRSEDQKLLSEIEAQTESPDANLLDRSYMHYALGKGYEDLAEYEKAIRHYDLATELAAQFWFKDRPADRDWYSSMIDATIERFTSKSIKELQKQGSKSSQPLLIVGMMRSGTTLVEQIVSSHPEVAAGGELTYWHDHASKVFNPSGKKIDSEALESVASGYLDLLNRIGPDAARVTDKLPHNYAMLGLVLAAFPKAKVIHVRRNPIDNCLSIYTTAFNRPPEFSLQRDNIVFAYQEYQRLMDHWRETLPSDQFIEVEYEQLIANRDEETRRLIDFAGLAWDEACLHHEENVRAVNTPSVWQVRQPIYNTSVERWRRFEPWLREFRDLA